MTTNREPGDARHAAIRDHRAARLVARGDLADSGGKRPYLHVPNELLVARDDLPHVEDALRSLGARELEVPGRLGASILRFEVPSSEHLPTLVTRLHGEAGERVIRLAPHHVFSGLPYIQGGPAGFPTAAEDRFEVSAEDGAGVRIAVLDTGFTPKVHPWLDARVEAGPGTIEETDVHPHNGWLDDEAGHGTFIAGLILQRAPGATIRVGKVLDSEGYGSELTLAAAIVDLAAEADIVNLSLGCYSHDDLPPVAIAEALRQVPPATAVVAAAGNDATRRPLWPAAHKRAIAVGALDDSLQRAPFSNYGWWVDAATPGVDVLSTFLDFDEEGHTAPIAGRTPQDFSGWARWNGTSFAAPRLAGAIAATMTRDGVTNARAAAVALLATSTRPADPDLGVLLDV